MKVIIFGSNGMLGKYVSTYLSNKFIVVNITRNEYNVLTNTTDDLERIIINNNDADYIINCLGLIPHSHKNGVSTTNRDYFKINSIFPNQLSLLSKQYNIKLIHITTDCVFSGNKGNYNEDDIHDEISDYGVSKSLGEPDNCCIIRTSIIGEEIRNKRSLLEWVKSNKGGEIDGYTNHYWNGITCLELAKIVDNMIENKKYWVGVRHIYSPESVSKYELVSIINDVYNLNIKINKVECSNVVLHPQSGLRSASATDKTICSKYDMKLNIKSIDKQIMELKEYIL